MISVWPGESPNTGAVGNMMRLATLPLANLYVYPMPQVTGRTGLTMAVNDITRDAVLQAIGKYDRLGQDGFMERYGFDRARQYLLVHDGKRYDSKAIVCAAHGFLPGRSADGKRVQRQRGNGRPTARRLEFTVQGGEALTAERLVRLLSQLQVYRRMGCLRFISPSPCCGFSAAPSITNRGLPPGQDQTSGPRPVRSLRPTLGRRLRRLPDRRFAPRGLVGTRRGPRDGVVGAR